MTILDSIAKLISGKVGVGSELRAEAENELALSDPNKEELESLKASQERLLDAVLKLHDQYELESAKKPSFSVEESRRITREREKDLRDLEKGIKRLNLFLTVPVKTTRTEGMTFNPLKAYLPTIKLPVFDGSMTEFWSFWDKFMSSIGSREGMDPVDKLNFLIGQLKGEAYDLVAGFPITGANYTAVVATLKENYGDMGKIITELIRQFHFLESPCHTLRDMKHFHAQVESTIRRLERHKCDIKGAEWYLSESIMIRLSPTSKDIIRNELHLKKLTCMDEVRKGLRAIIDHLESHQASANGHSSQSPRKEDKSQYKGENSKSFNKYRDKSQHWKKGDIGNYKVSTKIETEDVQGKLNQATSYS